MKLFELQSSELNDIKEYMERSINWCSNSSRRVISFKAKIKMVVSIRKVYFSGLKNPCISIPPLKKVHGIYLCTCTYAY